SRRRTGRGAGRDRGLICPPPARSGLPRRRGRAYPDRTTTAGTIPLSCPCSRELTVCPHRPRSGLVRRPRRGRRDLRSRRRPPPAARPPQHSYAVLEARTALGGTRDLFRFPPSGGTLRLRPAHPRPRVPAAATRARERRGRGDPGPPARHRGRVRHRLPHPCPLPGAGHPVVFTPGPLERGGRAHRHRGADRADLRDWLCCAGGHHRCDEGCTPHSAGRHRFAGPGGCGRARDRAAAPTYVMPVAARVGRPRLRALNTPPTDPHLEVLVHDSDWQPDILGDGYRQRILELGADPDGEGQIAAVLVRRDVRQGESVRGAVLYVHGFSDYFFQTPLADFLAARGQAFYALDLRKSGRARRDGQTAHYASDLKLYDVELERALAVVAEAHPGLPVVLLAHSTGGLIVPLWLDRRRAAGTVAPVAGLVLNSPWFDLQGKPSHR